MSRPGTIPWLASHELRLGFRDWLSLMTAGRRRKLRNVVIALAVFGVIMHLVAWPMVERSRPMVELRSELILRPHIEPAPCAG